MNARGAIRDAVRDCLEAALNSGESDYTIFTSRQLAILASEQLPAIVIYTPEELASEHAIGSLKYMRTLDVRIECVIAVQNDVDDVLDSVLSNIELAMTNNPPTVAGTGARFLLSETITEAGFEGEQPIGIGTLIYRCQYLA